MPKNAVKCIFGCILGLRKSVRFSDAILCVKLSLPGCMFEYQCPLSFSKPMDSGFQITNRQASGCWYIECTACLKLSILKIHVFGKTLHKVFILQYIGPNYLCLGARLSTNTR